MESGIIATIVVIVVLVLFSAYHLVCGRRERARKRSPKIVPDDSRCRVSSSWNVYTVCGECHLVIDKPDFGDLYFSEYAVCPRCGAKSEKYRKATLHKASEKDGGHVVEHK
jgi:hypothetical protein